jgi:hypothetical protein
MAEHRGLSQIFEMLRQPLFAATTIHVKGRGKSRPEKHAEVFDLTGIIKLNKSTLEIDGVEFSLNADTWVVGVPKDGLKANAKGVWEGGKRVATCLSIK